MNAILPSKSFSIVTPPILLAVAYFVAPYVLLLPNALVQQVTFAPYIVFVVTCGLGVLLERNRVILASLLLLMIYSIVSNITNDMQYSDSMQFAAINIATLLIPLNFIFFAHYRDKGIWSWQGVVNFSLIIGQGVLMFWASKNYPELVIRWLNFEFFVNTNFQQYSAISQLSVFIYVVSFLIMFKLLALESDVFISGFLGIMVATVMAFQAGPQRDLFYIYMTVAGLIPIMILAQNSYFLAYFDELTSLPGRRALNEELMHLRGQYTIAMLDVDHFKSFNDTFGHDVGDQVLKMVASKIRKIGGGGKAFRYGGEEFAVIFPGKTAKQAFPYLSNMRENLDQTHLMIRNKNRPSKKPEVSAPPVAPVRQVHVTISIGLAENVFNFEIQPEEVVKEADQALYRAKQKGRNRISQ